MLNILFINQPTSEYGQSFLIHGLTALGHNVMAWFGGTFYFDVLTECFGHCNHKDSPCKKLDIGTPTGCLRHCAHLDLRKPWPMNLNKPDLIITNNGYGNEDLHRFYKKRGVRIAALDLGDSPKDSFRAWSEVIGSPPDFFFRREYYPGQPGYPLQYSFYEEKSIFRPLNELTYSISFMGKATSPIRAEYSEVLKSIPNSFIGEVPHSQYLDVLSRSKFSVAIRGAGYDTVRRWEAPGRGSLLCAEEWPLDSDNDFEDGLNCIKFSNPQELYDKVTKYLNSSDSDSVYNTIRNNCYKHFLQHHTTKARAREFLKKCGFGS